MMLAFLFDQIQELGCKLFKRALETQIRKLYLTEAIRASFATIAFKS